MIWRGGNSDYDNNRRNENGDSNDGNNIRGNDDDDSGSDDESNSPLNKTPHCQPLSILTATSCVTSSPLSPGHPDGLSVAMTTLPNSPSPINVFNSRRHLSISHAWN